MQEKDFVEGILSCLSVKVSKITSIFHKALICMQPSSLGTRGGIGLALENNLTEGQS